MPDRGARRGACDGVSAADFVAGDSADRSPLRRSGGLLVGITGRVRADREAHQDESQSDTSHQNTSIWFGGSTQTERQCCLTS
jgi:hypothetical protein